MSMRRTHRAVTILAQLLAASFFVGFVTKFLPGETFFGPPYSVKFADWGYPSWFRFVVGTGELAGGIMLLLPRYRFVGCLLLAVILQGAVVTHVINHDSIGYSAAAPVTLSLVLVVAVASSPIGMRHLIPAREDQGGDQNAGLPRRSSARAAPARSRPPAAP